MEVPAGKRRESIAHSPSPNRVALDKVGRLFGFALPSRRREIEREKENDRVKTVVFNLDSWISFCLESVYRACLNCWLWPKLMDSSGSGVGSIEEGGTPRRRASSGRVE